jgi:DNA-binding response OmpR family regulator
MRKKRMIVFDDDVLILKVMKEFFITKNYEVITLDKPAVCPLLDIGHKTCQYKNPCADIILSDLNMPVMDGISLFQRQAEKDCKVDNRNKAIMSGNLDLHSKDRIAEMGINYFQKPLNFSLLSEWISECEKRSELYLPLGSRRKEIRTLFQREIEYMTGARYSSLNGNIQNLSKSGLCMKIKTPLSKDQIVKINTLLPIKCKRASVCWIRKTDENYYLAGLHCQ